MEVEPGYKLTESGVIPDDWDIERLGGVGRWFSGGTPSMANASLWSGEIPWVSAKDMKVSRLDDAQLHISEKAIGNGTRLAPKGAVLVVVRGMILAHTLPVALALRPIAFNQDMKALVVRDGVDNEFVVLWLQANAPKILCATSESTHGTKRLASNDLFSLQLALPRRAEQRAIAEALGDIDALLAALEKLIAKKRAIKQATMQQLLTGLHRLPGFLGKWPVKTLGELFSFSGGYTASRDQLSQKGYCYLHYGDIHKSRRTFINVCEEYQSIPKLDVRLAQVPAKSLLGDGDVVFVDASEDDAGTSKHVVVVNKKNIPFISGLHTIVAKGRGDELAHVYRRYCFQTEAVRNQFLFYAVGTKVSGISKTNIARLKIPVPPIPEQVAIANILSDTDEEIEALEQRLAKTRAIKQGMMQELLTGRIRLVSAPSNVVPLPVVPQAAPAGQEKAHNWAINEAVVISVLAKQFGSEKFPLGRKRYTKLSYLLHRHVEKVAEGYLKKAAGPYNPSTKYKGPESIAQKNGYIRPHNNGTYTAFVAADKIAKAEAYFEQWYGPDVLKWLEQFRFNKNRTA